MKPVVRQILGLWLVCAMMIAALVPAGFMPNLTRSASADGTLHAIVLCTGYGEKTVYVPASQSPLATTGAQDAAPQDPAHPDTASHTVCPYAPVLAQDMPAPALVPVPFVYAVQGPALTAQAPAYVQRAPKNWQGQAPPLS